MQDRDAVIERAKKAGVSACIITGSSLSSSMRAQAICDSSPGASLYFTAGVHPHEAKSCNSDTLSALRDLAGHPRCCAIGECGLDFNRLIPFYLAHYICTLNNNLATWTDLLGFVSIPI